MISASVADSEPVLRILIQKGAEVNEKSKSVDRNGYSQSKLTNK